MSRFEADALGRSAHLYQRIVTESAKAGGEVLDKDSLQALVSLAMPVASTELLSMESCTPREVLSMLWAVEGFDEVYTSLQHISDACGVDTPVERIRPAVWIHDHSYRAVQWEGFWENLWSYAGLD